jgi:hypothetical protein
VLASGRLRPFAAPLSAAWARFRLAGPPFPGEDFLANLPAGVTSPVDLADGSSMIVLTVEPHLGGIDPTGSGPFSIKPLLVAVPSDAEPMMSIALERDLSTVPGGRATF